MHVVALADMNEALAKENPGAAVDYRLAKRDHDAAHSGAAGGQSVTSRGARAIAPARRER